MDILYLALDCPLPANNGMRLRTWTLLQALHAEGCRTTLVCQRDAMDSESCTGLRAACNSFWILDHRACSLSQGRDWPARLRSACSPIPYAALRFRSRSVTELLERLCARRAFDAVFCDTVFAAINLPPAHPPLIFNHNNIEHRIFDTYRAHARNPLLRTAAAWESRKLERWEVEIGRRAWLNLVCSETDRGLLLTQQPDARVLVAPNISAAVPEPSLWGEDPDTLLFLGALDWFPNRDAVEHLLVSIWPLVLAQHPQARLLVVGRNPPAAFLARHRRQAGVEFTGTVPDIAPYLARAAAVLVPLRIGSGTRLKILDAAAAAKPVVSTPLGAEGLDFVPGEEIALAADPEAFAQAVLELLRSPERRRALGAAARQRVLDAYSFPVLRHSVRQALRTLPEAAVAPPELARIGA